jgi:broad specificity phosphatase PhoE
MVKNVELIFVRHGESYGNIGVREEGIHPDDPRLTENGIIQAQKLAAHYCNEPIAAIYSSALLRACQTVQPIAHVKGIQIRVLRELMEVGTEIPNTDPEPVKKYAPQAYDSVCAVNGSPVLFPTQSDDPEICEKRAAYSVEQILNGCKEGDTVMICTHGGFIGYLLRYCLGLSLPECFCWQIDNCSVFKISLSSDRIPKLRYANDISHLV